MQSQIPYEARDIDPKKNVIKNFIRKDNSSLSAYRDVNVKNHDNQNAQNIIYNPTTATKKTKQWPNS